LDYSFPLGDNWIIEQSSLFESLFIKFGYIYFDKVNDENVYYNNEYVQTTNSKEGC